MEIDRVTVKVEVETPTGKTSIEATAALDFREGRTKEDAAAAAYNLSRALQDSLDAGARQRPREPAGEPWDELQGSEAWGQRQQAAAPTVAPSQAAQMTERSPTAAPSAQGRFCTINGQELKQYSNAKGSWWSHKHPDGSWCKGQ